jgi:hypothetical protein
MQNLLPIASKTKPMKKIIKMEPGKLEEIVIISFFVLFFVLTMVAESTA